MGSISAETGSALAAAILLAFGHVLGGRLRRLHAVPRSWALSAASGVSVAYVFLHLLPEVSETQQHLAETLAGGWLAYVERHAWIFALVGLAAFYGLELLARRSSTTGDAAAVGTVHMASYLFYNGVIGYVLHDRAEQSWFSLLVFTFAMGIHFLVNDHGLREHHGDLYHQVGRWAVAGGVLLGWAVGALASVSEAVVGLIIAFLAGGVVMNVMKEELPEGRSSRFVPFAVGAVAYAPLVLLS